MLNFNINDILECISDGIYFVNRDRVITYWNKSAERISGYSSEEVVGKKCSDDILMHVDDEGCKLCTSGCPLSESIMKGAACDTEVFLHHKSGHRVPVWVRATPLRNSSGEILGAIEIFSDISSASINKFRLKELEKLALIDELTGLSNRRHITNELEAKFEEKGRYGLSFGIIMADIDNFKNINDTYGHNVGDDVLKTVANTLRLSSRGFDVFGRWGGEEFLAVLPYVDKNSLLQIAERHRILVQNSSTPISEGKITVTISIGATIAEANDTVISLVERADAMLYKSKKEGKNRVSI